MKRSEAAAKIRSILMNQKQREDFEYQILEVAETIGMLPPYKTKARIGDQFQHTWEKEKDEEK